MGSSPTGPTAFHSRAVAQWQSTVKSLVRPSSIAFCFPNCITTKNRTHSTAGVEYMETDRKVLRVPIPPRPLNKQNGRDLCTNTSSSV